MVCLDDFRGCLRDSEAEARGGDGDGEGGGYPWWERDDVGGDERFASHA